MCGTYAIHEKTTNALVSVKGHLAYFTSKKSASEFLLANIERKERYRLVKVIVSVEEVE